MYLNYNFATFLLFRYELLRFNNTIGLIEAMNNLNWTWIGYICICWIVVFILTVIGFDKYKKCASILTTILFGTFCIPTFLLSFFINGWLVTPPEVAVDLWDIINLQVKKRFFFTYILYINNI